MAIRVLKYHLRAVMAAKHKFLHVGVQAGDYFVWAEVDNGDMHELIDSPYQMIPTGYAEVHPSWSYKGTIVNNDNGTVWHVYDKRGA